MTRKIDLPDYDGAAFARRYGPWAVIAGASEGTGACYAEQLASIGGNVRVGLEDSLWAGRGRLAESNAEQVTLARQIIEGMGLEVATPAGARAILDLKGADRTAI